MNELTVFNNEEFGEIRTITIDGEPWFVAADVCVYFGVSNRNRIMQSVDAEDKGGYANGHPRWSSDRSYCK